MKNSYGDYTDTAQQNRAMEALVKHLIEQSYTPDQIADKLTEEVFNRYQLLGRASLN